MNMIVAVNSNWGIGYQGQLLYHIPEDIKLFKSLTMGKNIIYGRKTLETFPKKQPLPGRENYIWTRNPEIEVLGAYTFQSFWDLAGVEGINSHDTFCIGGAQTYKEFLPQTDTVYVTMVHDDAPADAFFPNLDEMKDTWFWDYQSEIKTHNGLTYEFRIYHRWES